jgi:hypothetical protein
MGLSNSEILTKDDSSENSLARWTEILDRGLERVMERMQRVVLEKLGGQKSKKSLVQGSLDIESVLAKDTWYKQLEEDVKPVLSTIIRDSQALYTDRHDSYQIPAARDTIVNIDAQMMRIKSIVDGLSTQVATAIYNSYGIQGETERSSSLRSSVTSIFIDTIANVGPAVALGEARRAWEFSRP